MRLGVAFHLLVHVQVTCFLVSYDDLMLREIAGSLECRLLVNRWGVEVKTRKTFDTLKKIGKSTKFNSPIIISITSTGSSRNRHESDLEVSFADERRVLDPFAFICCKYFFVKVLRILFYINR